MKSLRKQKVYDLLMGIETGDPDSVKVVNEDKYIQHNPHTNEGGEGLAQLFARLAKTNPKVEIVRLFEDGDFVFGHTIYNFSTERIGFEVFRYEGDHVVEHWDNIQLRVGDMIGGSTEIHDHDQTEANRSTVKNFTAEILINKDIHNINKYINSQNFVDHSTFMDISEKAKKLNYGTNHRILAEGNFVLSVNEGFNNSIHSSFYDLFRMNHGQIVEHWDTTEEVPPKSEWKNNNGKF